MICNIKLLLAIFTRWKGGWCHIPSLTKHVLAMKSNVIPGIHCNSLRNSNRDIDKRDVPLQLLGRKLAVWSSEGCVGGGSHEDPRASLVQQLILEPTFCETFSPRILSFQHWSLSMGDTKRYAISEARLLWHNVYWSYELNADDEPGLQAISHTMV